MEGPKMSAKAAHVNMMTDTIIANMPLGGLRSIMRGMLGGNAKNVSNFHNLASIYLANTRPSKIPELFTRDSNSLEPTPSLVDIQSRYRCLMGCGYGFESIELLTEVLRQIYALSWDENTREGDNLMDALTVVDGDIVQAVTAIQKTLLTSFGMKSMEREDAKVVAELKEILCSCQARANMRGEAFAFERGLSCLDKLISGRSKEIQVKTNSGIPASNLSVSSETILELTRLGGFDVPRIFMGLWQFSSPAWGTTSRPKIHRSFREHVDAGLVAYGISPPLELSRD